MVKEEYKYPSLRFLVYTSPIYFLYGFTYFNILRVKGQECRTSFHGRTMDTSKFFREKLYLGSFKNGGQFCPAYC